MPTTTMSSMTEEERKRLQEMQQSQQGLLRQTQQQQPAPTPRPEPVTMATDSPVDYSADITNLYQQYLGRAPEQAGLDYWTQSLRDGASMDDVRYNIANSQEGFGVATDRVTQAYQNILQRDPREEGLDYWRQGLLGGQTQDQLNANIRQSAEFNGLASGTIRGAFGQYLDREATPEELAGYLGQAKQGRPLEEIEAEIAGMRVDTVTRPENTNQSSVDTGAQTSVSQAADEAARYDATTAAASDAADALEADVTTRTVSPEETVQFQLDRILGSDSPILQRARTSGLQFANQRGLLNSSIAAQASEAAVLDAATRIAEQDAATYAGAAAQSTDALNQGALQDAQLGTNVSMFNVGETNATNRFNADSINQAGQFNANSANVAIQNFLDREAQRLLQDDAQLFTAEQNAADRELRQLLQAREFDFQGSQNNLDRELQTALQTNQQAFAASQADLDRQFQFDYQSVDQQFQAGQLAAQHAFASLEAQQQRDFEAWRQTNQNEWLATQAALDREFSTYQVNAQSASTVMFSTMEGIAAVYADPNLTASQKTQAAANLMNMAQTMPQFLANITDRMDPNYVPPAGGGMTDPTSAAESMGLTQINVQGYGTQLYQGADGTVYQWNTATNQFEVFTPPTPGGG